MNDDRPEPSDFLMLRRIGSRLADNDHFGHVNNAVYYEYFDTAVNGWLIETTGVHITAMPALGVVVANSCRYIREFRFPDTALVGIAVDRLGSTSVAYRLALFQESDSQPELCATATFVHVYVDPATRRPVRVPDIVRNAVASLDLPTA